MHNVGGLCIGLSGYENVCIYVLKCPFIFLAEYRMHLAECRYLGFLHLWFRQPLSAASPGVTGAVDIASQECEDGATSAFIHPNREEIILLLDQGRQTNCTKVRQN